MEPKRGTNGSSLPPAVPSPTLPYIPVGFSNRPAPVPWAAVPYPTLRYASGENRWTSFAWLRPAAFCSTFRPSRRLQQATATEARRR